MNRYLIMAFAATALAFQSCDRASSLSKELDGGWSGNPERLFDTQASSGTIIETYSFTPVDTIDNGGDVTISSLMSVTGAVNGVEGITMPISLTASGYAMISGTWQAISADRVELVLDQNSLTVRVDPDAVIINADMLTGGSAPADLTALKPRLSRIISDQLRDAVVQRYKPEMTMTSVSVKDGTTLKFKIDKTPYSLARQTE